MKYISRFVTALCLVGALLGYAPTAEAQFLKKLSKGLEKVNKTLKDANDFLDGNMPKSADNSSAKKSSSSAQVAETTVSAAETIDYSNWKDVEPKANTPYVSNRTRYMDFNGMKEISSVHEDIFAIEHVGGNISFWTIKGEKLFDAEWQYCGFASTTGTKFPKFNGGVAAAKRTVANSAGQKVICLLYANGGIKELDPTWTYVSDFADGVAVAKQKVGRKTSCFYINNRGEKIYPHISLGTQASDPIRSLNDGLRAVPIADATYSFNSTWGYINAKGEIIIAPQYSSAGDFYEGYAWVRNSDRQLCLINTKGEIQFNSECSSWDEVSEVSDGMFYIYKEEKYCYYNTQWQHIASYYAATPFYGGYAYVSKEGNYRDGITLINKHHKALRTFPSKKFFGSSYLSSQPRFEPYGLATVVNSNVDTYVINPQGDVVLEEYELDSYNSGRDLSLSNFSQFSEAGYALMGIGNYGSKAYRGIIRPSGEIAILFAKKNIEDVRNDSLPQDPGTEPLPPIEPLPPLPPSPWPPDTVIINKDGPAIGPKIIERTYYNVTVAVEGKGTASVSPSGRFLYGDVATLKAVPAEGWALASINVESDVSTLVDESKSFSVKSNAHVKVKFIEKDDDLPPPSTGCFQGNKSLCIDGAEFGDVTYYAQLNSNFADSNPYGENTGGFIVAMVNPRQRVENQGASAYFFIAPLKISGYQVDETEGKEWLVLDGGSFNVGDIKVKSESVGALMALYMQACITLDGFNYPKADSRHYRIEMLNHNKETGEFTCGNMQTFSPNYGWILAGDKRLTHTQEGLLTGVKDTGLPSDLFSGVKFLQAPKRDDVDWYPPIEWYGGNQDTYSRILEQMVEMYRTFQSDYDELFDE